MLYPSGEVRAFMDGEEIASPARADVAHTPRVTLRIGGRSVNTQVMVDDVRVWEGVVLDAVATGRAP